MAGHKACCQKLTIAWIISRSVAIRVREAYPSPPPRTTYHSLAHLSSMADEILDDFFPFLRVYKNGRVERLMGEGFVPPSLDPVTAVQSKDVEIAPEINLSARLFLPERASRSQKLPLLVYFHGGGFMIESAFSPSYHKHLNCLVAEAKVVAVSVNYRLAPESPLPVAFEDSWRALKWVAEGSDDWIRDFADLSRVYLGGDSAGANIAHNMAVRVGSEDLGGIHISGLILNCPFFSGKDPIGNESEGMAVGKMMSDRLWRYVCPGTSGCDDPLINPGMDPGIGGMRCERVLVYVAEKDFLRERGRFYKEVLEKSGWSGEVEVVEAQGEDHVFSVIAPHSESGMAMLNKVAAFINHR